MFLNQIWSAVNFHPGSFMTGLSALLLTALPAKILRRWFLQPIFGRWLGTVVAVLLVRQFLDPSG